MKFGLLHFRVFETDGVSLEMDKWRFTLEKRGHEVVYISGADITNSNHIYIEELNYKADYNKKIHNNAFKSLVDFNNEEELLGYIYEMAVTVEQKISDVIIKNGIDVLVPNNVSSLGFNLPVGIAIANLNKNDICKFIYHHHDFYFERDRYLNPIFDSINDILYSCFPYNGKAIHCTINELAKAELLKRKNIVAYVIPNVFDFNHSPWILDDYNNDLRNKLNIKAEDIVFLQATRIVKRKGIELGYYILELFSKKLKDHIGETLYNGIEITKNTKVHFVLAGLNEYEGDFVKFNKLINRSNVSTHYINDIVDHNRKTKNNNKIYSLWDVYTICDFITYPSVLEGWGNQLLEGLFAKKPMLVYEYPVFKSDIKEFGLELVTFDDKLVYDDENKLLLLKETTINEKADEVFKVLTNREIYWSSVNENFNIGKKSLSYEALTKLIAGLLEKL